jgi:N-carbamoyl-L-amino-acid hydrolase
MMNEIDLDVRIDPAGNILGRRQERMPGPVLLCGSHIDTVQNGGRFDGILGSLAAIEAAAILGEMNYTTRHPLEIAIFANEEGQNFSPLFGSRCMIGALDPADLQITDASGRSLAEAITAIGGNPPKIEQATRKKGEIHTFVELHIEQGGVLEDLGVPVGVVEGISGILYSDVQILGLPRHSGTTPMNLRKDALVAASRFVLEVEKTARENGLCRVATVGHLEVLPNSLNIVPGAVNLTLELRDLNTEKMQRAYEHLQKQATTIQEELSLQFKFSAQPLIEPVPAAPSVMRAIEAGCKTLHLSSHQMPSGAGHDAQMIARIAPVGMIFVPSVGGISHSEAEFTKAEDCVHGANVLLQTILRVDSGS